MIDDGTTLRTGEAAKRIGVSTQTIIRAFDNGHLKGYRVPRRDGTPGFRRVYVWSLKLMARRMGQEAYNECCPACGRPR